MKRKILLFMMTALLSVGAGAQSIVSTTVFSGSQEVSNGNPLVLDKAKLKGARVGSELVVTINAASAGTNIPLKGDPWTSAWANEGDTKVSILLPDHIISDINSENIPVQLLYNNNNYTVTEVTLSYNGVNLTSNFGANMYGGNSGVFQLKKSILTNASEGDILQVSVSSENFNGGWHMLSLTNGQGDFESMGEATEVYNAVPTSTEVTLEAINFSDITIGSLLTFNTTVEGLKAVSGETTLYENMWWCPNQTVLVTDENINTIKANGIIVTVNKLKDDSSGNDNTLTVKKANPNGTIAYWRTNDFSAGGTVNIPLTSALLGYASEGEGEGNLYLGGYGFTASSVDLIYIYAPMLANAGDNTTTISDWNSIPTNITLADRTLTKNGKWNTLCLPFAVSAEQLDESTNPLYGATIKELNASSSNLAANGTLTLVFTDASSIEAGKPYIVKWASGENVSNPLFKGVTITTTTPTAVEFTNNAGGGNCQFVGQFSPFTIDADNKDEIIMLGSDNMLGYSKDARTLRTFRAHFVVPTTSPGVALARAFVMNFGDEETTGIISVQGSGSMVNGSDAWYSLGGQRLQSAPTAKGVYIQNGRKVVVK